MTQEDDGLHAEVDARVRALLEEGLSSGRLTPGARLPTERALAADLRTSRAAVRRTLGALEREGVIIRHVGRGTFLATPSEREAVGDLQTSPAEIMAARLVLEPEVTALAARHATPADLVRMRHFSARGAAAATHEEFESWDAALHRAIAQAAHNGLLLQMFDTMNAARDLPVWGSIKRRTSTAARRAGYGNAHDLIVEALADRDPEAARDHMRAHLLDVRTNLLGPT